MMIKDHEHGPEVIKLYSCSTQLDMQFYLLINQTLPISTVDFMLGIAESEIFYVYAIISWHFHIHKQRKYYAQLS